MTAEQRNADIAGQIFSVSNGRRDVRLMCLPNDRFGLRFLPFEVLNDSSGSVSGHFQNRLVLDRHFNSFP